MGALRGPDGQLPQVFVRANEHRDSHQYGAHDPVILLARAPDEPGIIIRGEQLLEQHLPAMGYPCTVNHVTLLGTTPVESTRCEGQFEALSPRTLVERVIADHPGRDVYWRWRPGLMTIEVRGNSDSRHGLRFDIRGYPY